MRPCLLTLEMYKFQIMQKVKTRCIRLYREGRVCQPRSLEVRKIGRGHKIGILEGTCLMDSPFFFTYRSDKSAITHPLSIGARSLTSSYYLHFEWFTLSTYKSLKHNKRRNHVLGPTDQMAWAGGCPNPTNENQQPLHQVMILCPQQRVAAVCHGSSMPLDADILRFKQQSLTNIYDV